MIDGVRGQSWEPIQGKTSIHIPVKVDVPEAEGYIEREEFEERTIERRRPMIRREDVEKVGPTPGCLACHEQMLGETLVGVSHTEECRRKHEANMSLEKDPRLESAFSHRLQEYEEVMRRKKHKQASE